MKRYERKTPELQARLAYTASVVGSYAEAEVMAGTWGTPVSDGCIHQQVQKLGQAAQALEFPHPVTQKSEPPFSLIIMMAGWLARERGQNWGAGPRKQDPQRVDWREIKSAVIYRLEQRAQTAAGRGLLLANYVVATPPETRRWTLAKRCMTRRGAEGGPERRSSIGSWPERCGCGTWPRIVSKRRSSRWIFTMPGNSSMRWPRPCMVLGPAKPKDGWTDSYLRYGKESLVVRRWEERLESKDKHSKPTKEVIAREVNCFQEHRDPIHYRQMEKAGAPLGSGAVESLGKQLQRRLRSCGQFWGRPGLTHLLKLGVLVKNQDHQLLWN